jgi:hypothetical protein
LWEEPDGSAGWGAEEVPCGTCWAGGRRFCDEGEDGVGGEFCAIGVIADRDAVDDGVGAEVVVEVEGEPS